MSKNRERIKPIVSFTIDRSDEMFLEREAKRLGVSKSRIVQQAIRFYRERREGAAPITRSTYSSASAAAGI